MKVRLKTMFATGSKAFWKKRFLDASKCLHKNMLFMMEDGRIQVVLILVCLAFISILPIVLIWVYLHDPCDQYGIKQRLCELYEKKLIAGSLCYDLCIGEAFHFSRCLSQDKHISAFRWKNLVFKVKTHVGESKSKYNIDTFEELEEGITVSDFEALLQEFLVSKLGPQDHDHLIQRILNFADFNLDKKLVYGEANTAWELLHFHEFFLLFVFQESPPFPFVNGTCGPLYAVEHIETKTLFNKQRRFLDKFFSNTYRWQFPDWPKRANVAVGLLEFAEALFEQENSQFYICNITPAEFGYTRMYEAKVLNLDNVVSRWMLNSSSEGRKCWRNSDCNYNGCAGMCNQSTYTCQHQLLGSVLRSVCEIIKDYLLFDAPQEVKADLHLFLMRCTNPAKFQNISEISGSLQHNLILNELKFLIWDQVKNKPVDWLKRSLLSQAGFG